MLPNDGRVVSNFIIQALKGEDLTIYGNGTQTRSFCYVDDLINGRVPDAKYGRIAKLRSTHNNYLTLPVIFLMLSNHYPLAFASEYNWLIASLIFLMGVTIRHYFKNCFCNFSRNCAFFNQSY